MQFWAKKKSELLREKWGKIFEIFWDKTQLGGTGSGPKAGTAVGWRGGDRQNFRRLGQEKTLPIMVHYGLCTKSLLRFLPTVWRQITYAILTILTKHFKLIGISVLVKLDIFFF